MNKIVSKILKNAGVKAQITNDSKNPRFRVVDGSLRLEGVVSINKYSMKIKDTKGKSIDSLEVNIKNSNDITNRISESLETLHKLSPVYDKHVKITEDEDFEDLPEESDVPIEEGLINFYNKLLDLANSAKNLSNSLPENDAEGRCTIVGFVSALYDLAIDVDDYRSEFVEEDEDEVDESLARTSHKKAIQKVIENLNNAEITLAGHRSLNDIKIAIRDIKSELTVRSC